MYYKATIYFILLPRGMSIMTIEGNVQYTFYRLPIQPHIFCFSMRIVSGQFPSLEMVKE